jgi:small subunit ribosomal protein S6
LRRYETIFITLPELSEEDHSELQEKLQSILTQWNGELIKLDDWGVRKLGYEIRKNGRGRYFLLDYAADSTLVREIERNFLYNERVLKFQTVKVSDHLSAEIIKTLKEEALAQKAPKAGEPNPPQEESKNVEPPKPLQSEEGKET